MRHSLAPGEQWEVSILLDAISLEEAMIYVDQVSDAVEEMSPGPLSERRDVRFGVRITDIDEWRDRFVVKGVDGSA